MVEPVVVGVVEPVEFFVTSGYSHLAGNVGCLAVKTI